MTTPFQDPSSIPDMSLKVALNSFKTDMETLKGSLVTLQAQPRKCARKRIYVIGGSQRELCSAWARSECTYDSVEMFDVFSKSWVRTLDHYFRILYNNVPILKEYDGKMNWAFMK